MRWRVTCLIVTLMLLLPSAARAATCTISTVPITFGSYNVFTAPGTTAMGTVSYFCTSVGPNNRVTITLNAGNAGSFQPRHMLRAGIESLNYNLYQDAGMTQIWGDGTGGSLIYGPVHPNNNQSTPISIFGQIPAGQDVSIGSYTDHIIATINF